MLQRKLYGFSRERILHHLNNFKIVLKQNIGRHTYMTPLHEELHKNLNVFHTYTCNTLLFEFLLDCKEYEIKRDITDTLLNWTTELHPHFTNTQAAKYTHKVVFFQAMEYLNLMLWQTFPENISTYIPLSGSSPIISVVNEEWLRDQCKFLALVFISTIKQPQNLARLSLSKYTPWETERIVGDGNCLFRCISKILTGDQTSHLEIRSNIAHFIASERVTRIGWYFKQKLTNPCKYFMNEHLVSQEGTWGSDVEIKATQLGKFTGACSEALRNQQPHFTFVIIVIIMSQSLL
ncbi:ATP-dependent DNA helicase PIF1 [Oopsacas minuta]|uniref:ATP-dependent DNA helicase PIF1 n=1 Tax=Oopsacas minuta TaxID=111878 RepID=A0AAV7K077_9METZ|nr:ATP-dependent DNA helicase PIF1 [Oopsacas minuta]